MFFLAKNKFETRISKFETNPNT